MTDEQRAEQQLEAAWEAAMEAAWDFHTRIVDGDVEAVEAAITDAMDS